MNSWPREWCKNPCTTTEPDHGFLRHLLLFHLNINIRLWSRGMWDCVHGAHHSTVYRVSYVKYMWPDGGSIVIRPTVWPVGAVIAIRHGALCGIASSVIVNNNNLIHLEAFEFTGWFGVTRVLFLKESYENIYNMTNWFLQKRTAVLEIYWSNSTHVSSKDIRKFQIIYEKHWPD